MPRQLLYQVIYRHFKAEIESGKLRSGDPIPTEQELIKFFNVSRATTTRALQMLQSEHLIERLPGRGSYVAASHVEKFEAPPAKTNTRGRLVGMVAPFFNYAFGPDILAAVEQALAHQDWGLAVAASGGSQQPEEEAIRRLVGLGADGLIVIPVNGEFYSQEILRLHLESFPIVLIDKWLPGIQLPYVTSNNREAAEALTNHLLDLGHRAIAFFSPNLENTSTLQERFSGYEAALVERQILVNPAYVLHTVPPSADWPRDDNRQIDAIVEFLKSRPEVTAVFATDDELAYCWLESAHRIGYHVPRDFSIVCFDAPLTIAAAWSFTTAMQNQKAIGIEAVRLLLEKIRGLDDPGTEEVIVPVSIHVGQSTDLAPARLVHPS